METLFNLIGLLSNRDVIVFQMGVATGMATLIIVHLAFSFRKTSR